MSTTLLQCVAECFQGSGRLEGMHCLGAVASAEAASPSGLGNRGGVMSVVRALGVLVCEGRIQGPPRGYREGPHCAAPLQAPPNDHMCEKDNYLCGRYLVLVREISDRMAICSSLCVEVLMCSDCPCGLARATCKDPVSLMSSTSISQWQHPSDILLEYWSIGVVPSKSPEMMNSQGLYQAVRSRLHFSQVAAWWSRSNGKRPNYVSTRIVPYNLDNLRKFRDSPIEHTFPLAGIGDGNSIKVTVWALPRMEDVPTLSCSVHTIKDKDEECVARALTPTKNGPVPSASHSPETLVLPVLVDDRLQTPCDKPGKHHCRCEDEDGCPPSPSIRPNGERKRRRSLPCGPPESGAPFVAAPLPSVQEATTADSRDSSQSYPRYTELLNYPGRNYRHDEQSSRADSTSVFDNRTYLSNGSLERSFYTQVSLEEQEGNEEKRYKPSSENFDNEDSPTRPSDDNSLTPMIMPESSRDWNRTAENDGLNTAEKIDNTQFVPSDSSASWPFEALRSGARPATVNRETNVLVNPFAETSSCHEANSDAYLIRSRQNLSPTSPPCTVHQNYSRSPRAATSLSRSPTDGSKDEVSRNCFAPGKDLSHLMSKLAFPKEKPGPKAREDGGILDWFSKVPGRVLAMPVSSDDKSPIVKEPREPRSAEVKFKNCNLELSQREFNEVLAVLRARTPSGRRRTPVKTIRRRDRSEKFLEETSSSEKTAKNSNASEACVCPIHRQVQRGSDLCVCKFCRKTNNQPPHKTANGNSVYSMNGQCVYRCQTRLVGAGTSVEDWPTNSPNGILQSTIGKSTERLQSVSNKADVLLGAILRTSRERKGLTDISNGTRPRTVAPEDPSDARSTTTTTTTGSRVVPFEDEKSLPSVLNKRLHRFKQLFKKEWERAEVATTETPCQESLPSRKERDEAECGEPQRESRVKRKIDFTNFNVGMGKSQQSYERLVNGAISETHQNSKYNSTNGKRQSSNQRRTFGGECSTVSSCDGHRASEDEAAFAKRGSTPIASQNGLVSARSRCKNELIGVDADEDETVEKGVPSAIEQERFRRSLENAASMVFHSRTGLPLTSSPAPLRRGSCCFDYDSSLNSVSSKRSALFELNTPPSPGAVSLEETDREIENSGEGEETPKRTSTSRGRPQSHALLGSFEESALNGRLEPVSTVHGFTAELGASGSFCPKHRKLPVTVFFYTLGDNDKVSTPYLAHINLGKKGYQVPRSGTIQVTLLNPLGTVVKMFVVLYDLSDMPPRSHTFLRQRTLRDKTLRYLVHLRFMSGKSGRIYLHTDIRMIICRKSDVDTASDFGSEPPKELRSYIHGPTNPKFSPRC